MRGIFILLAICTTSWLDAQTTVGMVAYYTFDSTMTDVTGNTANTGVVIGSTDYSCGVLDEAVSLNGNNTEISFQGPVNNEFDTEDLTISFYFKSNSNTGTQYILSKRDSSCMNENEFLLRYIPSSNSINCTFVENANKNVSLTHPLDEGVCWNHVVIIRESTRVKMYVNGEFADEQGTLSRIDLLSNGFFTLGNAICKSGNDTGFGGLVDELRIYNRSLDEDEIDGLYFNPDQIINRDTNIFLGSSVDIQITNTCAEDFNWTPNDGVTPAFDAEPVITPKVPGAEVYVLELTDMQTGCTAVDSIRINVVDPDDLECDVVYLPKAFTPNGDNINDTFGISNPFAVPELISFEIFDRWGGRVFATANAFEQWDGNFDGQAVNPGVMIYKIVYVCEGVEQQATGTFTILK